MLLTFYRVAAERSSLLADLKGVVVHDHWQPYYTLQGVLHALCNAHHLREPKARSRSREKTGRAGLQRLLRRACHAVNLAREQNGLLKRGLIALIERRCDASVADGLAFHAGQPPLTKAKSEGGRRDASATKCAAPIQPGTI